MVRSACVPTLRKKRKGWATLGVLVRAQRWATRLDFHHSRVDDFEADKASEVKRPQVPREFLGDEMFSPSTGRYKKASCYQHPATATLSRMMATPDA